MSRAGTRRILMLVLASLLLSHAAFSGVTKTGGRYEIMSDTLNNAGAAPITSGRLALYQSMGEKLGYSSMSSTNYTLIDGFLGVVDETPPAITFSSPSQSAGLSGSVPVAGTVFDENGAQWIVSYGPGQNASVWKQISSGAQNISGGGLATWDASRLSGNYTLAVNAVDSRGNRATGTITVTVANAVSYSALLPVDKWSMISLPGIPLDSDPHTFLGSTRYEVQRWDPTMSDGENGLKYKCVFPVTAGDAFWVKPYRTPISYSVSAWVPDTTVDYRKRLEVGWNQIGAPFNRNIGWGFFRFLRDGDAADVPVGLAVTNGWINSLYYSFDADAKTYRSRDVYTNLEPFVGYFVYATVPGTLLINPGAGMPNGLMRIVRPKYDWRLQISAQTDDAMDADNFAGVLSSASDGFNADDSMEPPTIDKFVSLYFPHDDWGPLAGGYAADFRAIQKEEDQEKLWDFVVRTSDPGKSVTLTWPNAAALPENYRIRIRDTESQSEIDPRTTPSYTFVTDATGYHRFRLSSRKISDAVNSAPETTLNRTLQPGWNLLSVPLEPDTTDARVLLSNMLSQITMIQYYDKNIYSPESSEGIDIQAGIGYWVYAANPVDLAFKGRTVKRETAVDIPLVKGWNLIGNPYTDSVPFGDGSLRLICGTSDVPLSDAMNRGWIDGKMYEYATADGDFIPVEPNALLKPWTGYALKAKESCTLRFMNE